MKETPVCSIHLSATCAPLLPYFLPSCAHAAFASPASARPSGDHACTSTPRLRFLLDGARRVAAVVAGEAHAVRQLVDGGHRALRGERHVELPRRAVESVGAGGERPAWPRPDGAARAAGVLKKGQGARWVATHRPRRRRPPRYGMVSAYAPLEGLRGRRGAR